MRTTSKKNIQLLKALEKKINANVVTINNPVRGQESKPRNTK
jgi:wobble nucleotide-excising tRNase